MKLTKGRPGRKPGSPDHVAFLSTPGLIRIPVSLIEAALGKKWNPRKKRLAVHMSTTQDLGVLYLDVQPATTKAKSKETVANALKIWVNGNTRSSAYMSCLALRDNLGIKDPGLLIFEAKAVREINGDSTSQMIRVDLSKQKGVKAS